MTTNVQETLNEGLKREYSITVPKAALDDIYGKKIQEASKKANIKGFRKGKVPVDIIKKQYGASVVGEILEETVKAEMQKLFVSQKVQPVAQPSITPETIYENGKDNDFVFKVGFEIMPEIPEIDLASITVNKYVFPVEDSVIDNEIAELKKRHGNYTKQEDSYEAKNDDKLVIDFKGFMDGEAFPGGEATDYPLVLGSQAFIPGFEEQLVGAKTGDILKVEVSFPEEYHAQEFAGKPAYFDVTVKEVLLLEEAELEDAIFEEYGVTNEEELRASINKDFEVTATQRTRMRTKQELFDTLDEMCTFPIPEQMQEGEYKQILAAAEQQAGEDEAPTDEEKEELKRIAGRRVRLGLYLAQLGEKNGIQITNEDLTVQLYEQSRQFGIPPQKLMEYYKQNQDAVQGLRGKALEEKAVNFLLETVTRTTVEITEEAFEKLESEEAEQEETKPKKKAPAKKKAVKKDESSEATPEDTGDAVTEAPKKKAPAKKKPAAKKEDKGEEA